MKNRADSSQQPQRELSRRELLQLMAYGTGLFAVQFLPGCAPTTGVAVATPAGAQPSAIPAASVPVKGGTLRVVAPSDIAPKTLVNALTPTNGIVLANVYETLTRYRLDRLEAQPLLADSWQFSPDLSTLTFKLAQGVKFHSGRAFTSADVKWNIERVTDPAAGSQLLAFAKWITKTDTPDDNTVVLHFDKPRASALDLFENLVMADKDTYQASVDGKTFNGTGPFVFKEWVPGDHYTLARNPSYRLANRPYLDEVTVKIIPEAQTRLINLQTGAADMALSVEPRDASDLKKDPKYQVRITPVWFSVWYVGVDVKAAPFTDKRARQAIAYLIDRKRIVDTQLIFGAQTQLPWDPTSPAFNADQNTRYTFDASKAKELWQQAGGSGDTNIPISVSNALPPTLGIAEVLQSELAKLGVKSSVEKFDAPAFTQKQQSGGFKGLWVGAVSFMHLNPSSLFLQAFAYRVPNSSNFDTPDYRQQITAISETTEPAQLTQVYRKINDTLLDEAFVIPVASSQSPTGALASVKGITETRFAFPLFGEYWKTQ